MKKIFEFKDNNTDLYIRELESYIDELEGRVESLEKTIILETRMNTESLKNIESMLTFGKYKDTTLSDIFIKHKDYSYILWLNLMGINVPKGMLEMCQNYLSEGEVIED